DEIAAIAENFVENILSEINSGHWAPILEESQARILKGVLNIFCEYSGHKINAYKTNVCFSKGVDDALAENLCNILGFQRVQNLGKYLGVPFFHNRVIANTLRFVVDNSMMIPKRLCKEIEHMVRQFIWGASSGGRKLALVNWDTVLKTKYGIPSGMSEKISQGKCSILWKALAKTWPLIKVNLIWSVGDGRKIRCWRDPWIPNVGVLANLVPGLSSLNMDCLLSDMVLGNGRWNLDLFRIWLPEESAYRKLREDLWNPKEPMWNIPLKFQGPQRVRFFIWLVFKHRLRAKEEMVRSGILHVCGHISEDIIHVLKDCTAARSIWDRLIHVEWHIRNSAINSQDSNLWLHVDGNWVCLYTDGSVQNDGSFAAAEGITNSHGKWILGYNRYLGYDRVLFIFDNLEGVQAIQEKTPKGSNSALVRRIHQLL
ncbi:hypothetical protein Gotri_025144, partial [Gossypium trilobum]|nr:hypothetical protein [Gossypium trilobum]